MDPLGHWRRSPQARAQQLYVAFSEIASSCLDYCEGSKVLREAAASNGRLNWASTILYYCMIHSARLLVFLPFGDFPTNHAQLAKCFAENGGGGVRTNWLDGFAGQQVGTYRASVTFARISEFWSIADQPEGARRHLVRMGQVLIPARNLRNENNYEALLIAHEYQHPYVTPAFRDLADTMREAASEALKMSVEWFRAYLLVRVGATAGGSLEEAQFVSRYVRTRVEQPIQSWYGTDIADETADLLRPLSVPSGAANDTAVERMERDVDFAVFHPKAGLMTDFERKVGEFRATVQYPRVYQERKRRLEAEERRRLEAQKRKTEKATHDIFNAIRRSDVAAVNGLIAKGADVHATDQEGRTPLMRAEERGNERIVQILRDAAKDKRE
jgi:hypothetical protein